MLAGERGTRREGIESLSKARRGALNAGRTAFEQGSNDRRRALQELGDLSRSTLRMLETAESRERTGQLSRPDLIKLASEIYADDLARDTEFTMQDAIAGTLGLFQMLRRVEGEQRPPVSPDQITSSQRLD